jgi:hypothetical protein
MKQGDIRFFGIVNDLDDYRGMFFLITEIKTSKKPNNSDHDAITVMIGNQHKHYYRRHIENYSIRICGLEE